MKKCAKCKLVLDDTKFLSRTLKNGETGLQSYCRDCNSTNKLVWIQGNRDRVRQNTLWSRYRMRQEDYDNFLKIQDSKCVICKELLVCTYIDHDHKCCPGRKSCGKCVRGLLCQRCNTLVGWYETNLSLVPAVIEYTSRVGGIG